MNDGEGEEMDGMDEEIVDGMDVMDNIRGGKCLASRFLP